MPNHRIVDLDEWTAARNELLVLEKELTAGRSRAGPAPARTAVGPHRQEYTLQTATGPRTLAQLFDGRSQLVMYNFMFGPDYEAGCPVCSSIADSFNGVLEHLKARDVTMICVSRAPVDKLVAYRQRMGWNFPWASSFESDFNFDFQRSVRKETVGHGSKATCPRFPLGSPPTAAPTPSATWPSVPGSACSRFRTETCT